MAKKSKDSLLNREMGDGAGGKVKENAAPDPGKAGYHKSDMGPMEKENYRIADGYQTKDESPARMEGSSIHEIAHHSVTGELYSGHPERHGHFDKVAKASATKDKPNVDEEHTGGSTNEEEN